MINRFKGAFMLAAAADALGWINEFEYDYKSLVSKYGIERITEFLDWKKKTGGKFLGYTDYIEKGSYSDDTQLLLCVCRSITPDGSVDNEYFSKVELRDWLLYVRGGGKSLKTAARNLEKKTPQWYSNFYKTPEDKLAYFNAGANGAAMRMLPIVLSNLNDHERMIEEVFKNSIITHGHPRAIIGAILFSLSLSYFMKSDVLPDNQNEIIMRIANELKTIAAVISKMKDMELSGWLEKWDSIMNLSFHKAFNHAVEETLELLRYAFKSITAETDDRELFLNLGALDKKTKGAGHISAVAALYMTTKYVYESPIQAVYECANILGSDTDTIGLMCGSMIGAYISFEQIPNHLKRVQDSQYLLGCADALYMINNNKGNYSGKSIRSYSSNIDIKPLDYRNLSAGDEIYLLSLGSGIISSVSEQDTITGGKSVLILEVDFEIGQSCKISKVLTN
jgi:ADP-ribosylglycohydrolase